ncbi:transcriptional regulator, AraC type; possible DNA gyrase inhibitor [Caballeronia glathei]|uniref:AraC family transcriptional regulator n=1 Tax=Caballeronia glathei TaxID=60547 RepID=A0A069PI95_9BURK|nr:GyrI-like domain-containing protein [Caballeronia glathei]KDR40315.1 AraC family transcriptional regulator [Caballeronia glathei]CDY76646.1 transcriptional regulator, AraC type; possible DNA gyrase inhibitor [Caballeronia glathei]
MNDKLNERFYETRLSSVVEYIHDHLDDDLDLNRLAEIACLSPYHWHRIYHAFYGETAAATVRRLRLHRAANELVRSASPLDTIGQRAGYSSVQAFSRAFQASYRMPPAQFRNEGGAALWRPVSPESARPGGEAMHPVEIRTHAPFTVAAVEHRGPYMNIGQSFETVSHWLARRGRLDNEARWLGIYFDDPDAVAESDLRSQACVELAQPRGIEFEAPVSRVEVAGGDFAVLTHVGPYAQLCFAYQWLYGEWLPHSGRETGDAPVHEVYLNDPRETPPTELVTEIWLPVKPRP